MFDYAGVAVEIWQQILLAVLDLPYVLDTLINAEMACWRKSHYYHDPKVYAESEHQRKTLRLVCRSWRAFADEYQYRWITYHQSKCRDTRGHKDALEAIRLITAEVLRPDSLDKVEFKSRPRRILFHITKKDDMTIFRNAIDYCSQKLTILHVKGQEGFEDQIFESIVKQSSNLPMLRCLELMAPRKAPKPLQTISSAFPALTSFEMKSTLHYKLDEGDYLVLPDLHSLGFDVSNLTADYLQKWDIPAIVNLSIALGRRRITLNNAQIALEPIKSLGATLVILNIWRAYGPIRLPVEFWTWCPCLIEFSSFFSWIFLDSPAPTHHPLRYVVHWAYYDEEKNPLVTETPNVVNPAVLHSLACLPQNVEHLLVWQSWTAYMAILQPYDTPEHILRKMNEICVERAIRVEDKDGVALGEFLASKRVENK